jgi:hypothetical protein
LKDGAAELGFPALAGDPIGTLLGLASLSFVPDLLNILPMYVILLAFVPLAMALFRINALLVFMASLALWVVVQETGLNLRASGAGRTWFFDPFAWQLIFFTGFAFGMGWVPRLGLNHPVLLAISAAAVVLSVPLNFWAFTDNVGWLRAAHDRLIPDGIVATTRLDMLRYAHFLCLAYVMLSLLARRPNAIRDPHLSWVLLIGRQSLPAFVATVVLAWSAGIVLDVDGRGFAATATVNLLGFAAIYTVARTAAWLKLPHDQIAGFAVHHSTRGECLYRAW